MKSVLRICLTPQKPIHFVRIEPAVTISKASTYSVIQSCPVYSCLFQPLPFARKKSLRLTRIKPPQSHSYKVQCVNTRSKQARPTSIMEISFCPINEGPVSCGSTLYISLGLPIHLQQPFYWLLKILGPNIKNIETLLVVQITGVLEIKTFLLLSFEHA